jgi:hypothetical protein
MFVFIIRYEKYRLLKSERKRALAREQERGHEREKGGCGRKGDSEGEE